MEVEMKTTLRTWIGDGNTQGDRREAMEVWGKQMQSVKQLGCGEINKMGKYREKTHAHIYIRCDDTTET